ncbi:hypothetical protein KFK09_027076 [Dendrobium nobile]|uniref:Cytochrome P450 78A5 n=1 Tax=Dendrobium nobile TaxID=94219 RepID=A0A8T3A9D9_DENNO|nr:hypothetical protein KFK09_027076 [Dendrobium nobile]
MKTSLASTSVLLLLSLAASIHVPWLLLLLLATLSTSLPLFLTAWLGRGGLAWARGRAQTQLAALIPPGPSGWPLLGSIPSMGPLAHRNLASMSTHHNARRLMALSLGATPVVISTDPTTAREILFGPGFSDRPIKASARLLMFERAIGFAPAGDYWRHLRRISATHMFSPRRIAVLEGVRRQAVDNMVAQVQLRMDAGGHVVVREVVEKGSLESVLGSVFGKSVPAREVELLAEMVREGYELIGRFNWEDHLPLGALLDFYGVARRCKHLASRVQVVIGKIMEDRRREEELHQDDFLGVLLGLPKEESLSDGDIIAVLWEMIFRGTDVVAILMEWIMARMVLHPAVQAKAQQELHCIVGNRPVNDSDIPKLCFLQAVVKETLRMHPPGPLLSWARLAVHDVHVGKYFVPSGTTAMVNMWAIAHDPKIWKDPWVFRPERFLEEEVNIMGSDLRLAPFGAGRRVCPGRALGLTTVHLWLARFLQEYTWVAARPVQLVECLRLSLEMKKPLIVRAILR